nr:unnamed protein product [Callosobruchus analis]
MPFQVLCAGMQR